MKHIKKNIANEPESLREYRENTPNAKYEGGNFNAKDLKKALLDEQGYICAYCMSEISLQLNEYHKPKIEVEHFKPQETYPALDLHYNNMLAVCNGLSETYPENVKVHHCDKTQGENGKINGKVELRRLNPLTKVDSEDLLCYDLNGIIKSKTNLADVEFDLNEVLNLNNKVLVKNRKTILDVVQNELKKDKPLQEWNKAFFDKHLQIWQTRMMSIDHEGNTIYKFRKYCMVAIWFINQLKLKPKYV